MVVHHVAPSPGLMPLALIDHPTRRISRKPMNRFATAFFRWRRYCNTPSLNPLLLQAASRRQKFFGSYQQGKQNTSDERNNPMPTIRALVRSSAFLRRSDTQPEEKFVHRSERHHRRCFVVAIASYLGVMLSSKLHQEQPQPGTAGGALVSKLPSWRRSALSRIFRAASVGIADVGFWGRSGNLVLDQSTTGF